MSVYKGIRFFERKEFACKCGCGFDTVDAALLYVLERLRERFGPIKILSGCRCEAHNESIGGAKHSQHVRGRAADIKPLQAPLDEVKVYFLDHVEDWLEGQTFGLGSYRTFLHIDTRTAEKPAFWMGWHRPKED